MAIVEFHWVDVFADRPFGGYPQVVFAGAADLTAERMQLLASELGQGETAFLLEPSLPGADVRIRCFSTSGEVPPGGGAVLGAHYVRALLQPESLSEPVTIVRQETGGELSEVELHVRAEEVTRVAASLRCQGADPPLEDGGLVAAALRIPPDRIGPGELRPRVVGAGRPWLLVPLVDLKALRGLAVDPGLGAELAAHAGTDRIYAFTMETLEPGAAAHGRHLPLGDPHGREEPVSGSAAAAVGLYLVVHQVLLAAPSARLLVEQGHEVGRPCLVDVEVLLREGRAQLVKVGGTVIHVGLGRFEL